MFIYESTLINRPWYSVWPHLRRIITGSLILFSVSLHSLDLTCIKTLRPRRFTADKEEPRQSAYYGKCTNSLTATVALASDLLEQTAIS